MPEKNTSKREERSFSELRIWVPLKFDDVASSERGGDIDKALVAGATEHQVEASLRLNERTIDKDLQIGKHLTHDGVGQNLLEGEAGVAPDGAMQFVDNALGKSRESLGLIHRVAAREGDVALSGCQTFEDLIDQDRFSCLERL